MIFKFFLVYAEVGGKQAELFLAWITNLVNGGALLHVKICLNVMFIFST